MEKNKGIQTKNDIDQLLADSLKELAAKRPMEKITIKEITDKAGVIRPTFYNHFQDKFELLEWIIRTELLEPILPLVRSGMVTEAMVLLFTSIEQDKTMIIYESPFRLVKTLEQLAEHLGADRKASVSREISKKFEETRRGTLEELIASGSWPMPSVSCGNTIFPPKSLKAA